MPNHARLETTRRKALTGFGAAFGIAAGLSTSVQAQTPTKTLYWCMAPGMAAGVGGVLPISSKKTDIRSIRRP